MGNDTGGLDDSGLINFNASYDDWQMADTVFISGTDPFESKTIVFTEFLMKGPKLIIAVPRRSAGVAYAEANDGLFLQVIPGSDTLLHLAISRYILENNCKIRHLSISGLPPVGKSGPAWGAARVIRPGSGAPPGASLGRFQRLQRLDHQLPMGRVG